MMILNNIYFLSLSKLIILWLIFYVIIIIINYYYIISRRKYGTKEKIKSSFSLIQIYLDQFYINNKWYTFIITFIYSFGIIFLFIIIRYISLGDVTLLLPQANMTLSIISLSCIYIIIMITVILYRNLLIILCKKEINKFYIYLEQLTLFHKLQEIIQYKPVNNIIGILYLLTYRISTLTYSYPQSNNDEDYDYDDNEK